MIKVRLALVLLFRPSESIHNNASSPSVRRAMFIDFNGAQAALRQERHVCDPIECNESWKADMTLLTEAGILGNRTYKHNPSDGGWRSSAQVH